MEGAEICLPVQRCEPLTGDPGAPLFETQDMQLYHYGVDTNSVYFNISARSRRICFRNVTESINYVEYCHTEHLVCSQGRNDLCRDKIELLKSVSIQVQRGNHILT